MTKLTDLAREKLHATIAIAAITLAIMVSIPLATWTISMSNRLTRVETQLESIEKTVTQIHQRIFGGS